MNLDEVGRRMKKTPKNEMLLDLLRNPANLRCVSEQFGEHGPGNHGWKDAGTYEWCWETDPFEEPQEVLLGVKFVFRAKIVQAKPGPTAHAAPGDTVRYAYSIDVRGL